MDEYDELSQSITYRIDYEKRLRDRDYNERLKEYQKVWQYDSTTLITGDLKPGPGVVFHHRQLIEQLDKEYDKLRQLDEQKFQNYWDQLNAGKYKQPPADKERHDKINEAEKTFKMLVKNFDETGIRISSGMSKALDEQYGKDVMELVRDKVAKDREAAEKKEKERLALIQKDKEAAAEKKKQEEKQKDTQQKMSVFDWAEQEITQKMKMKL